ncbi:NADH-ubiquinone oxidoreductase-F iron-sulfur binding region domain-containing protein [Desulfovibrio sp. TomC]|uniref:NADH-ubiquinone oxidoreductase-F iron-sulfur binding region domain-containing protein n=1 Tax=Desulfovibrio sp. TomC TaxID=1562888 RepID=UPI0005755C15|nr:NADH-ubiquinone oxidoreductase-F iron-sulfur binding region domain-containing protein [Desulfovibrio sp. TomC]KHK01082.1 NAD-reducing hydrogenase subunit HoxF [Desulfovibrio sp. TomC]
MEGPILETQTAGVPATAASGGRRVIVCAGTGCVANGSKKVLAALEVQMAAAGLDVVLEFRPEGHGDGVRVSHSGCQGFCQMGPLVTILPENILYTKVTADDVPDIVEKTLVQGQPVERLLYIEPRTREKCLGPDQIPFYQRQTRSVLKECGFIDPDDIREYVAHGGYAAAGKAFSEMDGQGVCDVISQSGLRGRGGGGFPTGRKWEAARVQTSPKKYVICNGDEGDPGAFMDRSLMEGNPHCVIEGMMIAARGIGADEGYIYVRAEYPLAVKRMRKAVADAEAAGYLGDNLFGSGQSFRLEVMEGAGAFVCGEETALIASIEGLRGMPAPKPPFPAQQGLWRKPTIINNVETLAQIPRIISEGAASYRSLGTETSPGTKTFALTGHVSNTGLIEVPFGATLREVVLNIGGGVTDDRGFIDEKGFKAVQIGGPSGGCLTPDLLDLPLDFDSLRSVGAMVGSGGLVVMNQKTCMVSVARFFMEFTQRESCGKCVLCREGTKQLLALLDDVIEGRGTAETLSLLETLGHAVQVGSLCGLGKTAPNPVLSTLKHFRKDYEEHVFDKRCSAGRCKALAMPTINAARCKGCRLCVKACPAGAISGEKKQPHVIDEAVCIKCGACATACKFGAVEGI